MYDLRSYLALVSPFKTAYNSVQALNKKVKHRLLKEKISIPACYCGVLSNRGCEGVSVFSPETPPWTNGFNLRALVPPI